MRVHVLLCAAILKGLPGFMLFLINSSFSSFNEIQLICSIGWGWVIAYFYIIVKWFLLSKGFRCSAQLYSLSFSLVFVALCTSGFRILWKPLMPLGLSLQAYTRSVFVNRFNPVASCLFPVFIYIVGGEASWDKGYNFMHLIFQHRICWQIGPALFQPLGL